MARFFMSLGFGKSMCTLRSFTRASLLRRGWERRLPTSEMDRSGGTAMTMALGGALDPQRGERWSVKWIGDLGLGFWDLSSSDLRRGQAPPKLNAGEF